MLTLNSQSVTSLIHVNSYLTVHMTSGKNFFATQNKNIPEKISNIIVFTWNWNVVFNVMWHLCGPGCPTIRGQRNRTLYENISHNWCYILLYKHNPMNHLVCHVYWTQSVILNSWIRVLLHPCREESWQPEQQLRASHTETKGFLVRRHQMPSAMKHLTTWDEKGLVVGYNVGY